MKFFIFTCLLAVALAKHKMEHSLSSGESVNISQEKFKQEKNVVIHPIKVAIYSLSCEESARNIKEMEHFSSSSSEESAEVPTEGELSSGKTKHYLKQLNKINQFYQKKNFLEYLQALHQPQIVRSPWGQIKSSAYPFLSAVNGEQLSISEESASITQEEATKTVDMKAKLTKEKQNLLNLLNKMAQYHQKFPLPQYFKTVQYQTSMKPWNHIKANAYQIIPAVRYF